MQIKMNTAVAGPEFSAHAGQVVDLPDLLAGEFVKLGYATPIKSLVIEAAILPQVENAAIITGKKGKK